MIVVKVELWPHGDKSKASCLGGIIISNDGTGTDTRRNYVVTLHSRGDSTRVIRRTRILGFPSKALPAWRLIARAYDALTAKESVVTWEDKPIFWAGGLGSLMCDRAIQGVTQDFENDADDPQGNIAAYKGKHFVCETIGPTAAKKVALALGGIWTEEPPEEFA